MSAEDLYYNREQWTRNLGDKIPMLRKEDFFKYLLPKADEQEVKTMMGKLMDKQSGVLLPQEKSQELESRWTGIPIRASEDTANGNDAFLPLKDIIECIRGCKGDVTFTEFKMNPNQSLDSETDFNANFNPDGYDVLKEGCFGNKIHESHITWILQLKRRSSVEQVYDVSYFCGQ